MCQNVQADLISASVEDGVLRISKIICSFYVFALTNMQFVAFFFYLEVQNTGCLYKWVCLTLAV